MCPLFAYELIKDLKFTIKSYYIIPMASKNK